jgi:hypothetical protein
MLTALRSADARARVCGEAAAAGALLALIGTLLPDGLAKFGALGIFVLFGPGAAIVAWWEIGEDRAGWMVAAVTLSLSVCCVISSAMIWIAWWHPAGAFAVLAALTLAGGLAAPLWRNPQRRS